MQQADRVLFGVVGAEGVRTDEFGEPVGLVRFRGALGPHLVKDHGLAALRQLPCSLAPGEAASDDVNGLIGLSCHGRKLEAAGERRNPGSAGGGPQMQKSPGRGRGFQRESVEPSFKQQLP
ncbi:hypothetical protein GCM10008179_30270 [Hansschlegelia plantiphila]|uniref:Uncharacterized protein n=1 Tax=Hansschlegelia plantiphila TaxID=374655 RepID=A0A9W6J4S3_9HYPH|nr:hypothetical protein GCM10008179_30270 [Hansschlegelia plantiphila]